LKLVIYGRDLVVMSVLQTCRLLPFRRSQLPYYRISEITIRIPPLRERDGGCRILLARTLLERFAGQHRRVFRGFSPDAQNAIENYAWPGNVRELENKLKGAVIMAEGRYVTAADLGLASDGEQRPNVNLREIRKEAETLAIRNALAYADGNISKTAQLLGVTRPTLYDLLEKYGIQYDKERGS
jgi:two-component system NtrC family response regulator